MRYAGLGEFKEKAANVLAKGPIALIFLEDQVEIDSTLQHHLAAGFKAVIVLGDAELAMDADLEAQVHRIHFDIHQDDAIPAAVTTLAAQAPAGTWFYYCYNAEYLFFPFCETRNVVDLVTFQTEERRAAILTYVIDLYAGDLGRAPNAVNLEDAHLDRSGYYALARKDPDRNWEPKDRQLDFYGGLRWRFEEHVTWAKRKIDRIALFRTAPGLVLRADHTFSDEEYNTYSCPWHHNVTACICSFRTAKALKSNPGSRYDIHNFRWHSSTEFLWHSQQLMDLGLMEPGQWF